MKKNILVLLALSTLIYFGCTDPQPDDPTGTEQQPNNGTGNTQNEQHPGEPGTQQPGEPGTQQPESPEEELIIVSPRKGLKTDSIGTSTSIEVVLSRKPTHDVTITAIGSSEEICSIENETLVFNENNWNVPQKITITGQKTNFEPSFEANLIYTLYFEISSMDADFQRVSLDPIDIVNGTSCNVTAYGGGYHLVIAEPDDGLLTNEAGSSDFFLMEATSFPAYDVIVKLRSSRPDEVILDRDTVVLTPENKYAEIVVTGVDDKKLDGTQPFEILVESVESLDPFFDGIQPEVLNYHTVVGENGANLIKPDMTVFESIQGTNEDNDDPSRKPGLVIHKVSSSQKQRSIEYNVSENGDHIGFNLTLDTAPLKNSPVTVTLHVTDITEGAVSPSSLVFDDTNYNIPQSFVVKGVDDGVCDGDMPFSVILLTSSNDISYNDLEINRLQFLNQDNETGDCAETRANIEAITNHAVMYTNEDGLSKTVTLIMTHRPKFNVTVYPSSSDPTEGEIETGQEGIVFTPEDWYLEHQIRMKGLDDNELDGNVDYQMLFRVVSEDRWYNDFQIPPVDFRNFDNDNGNSSGNINSHIEEISKNWIIVSGVDIDGINYVSETGDTKTMWVRLGSAPASDVEICYTTSNPIIGYLDDHKNKVCHIFTKDNYNIAQKVVITGNDDKKADGDRAFKIKFKSVVSDDPNFNEKQASPIQFINKDKEEAINVEIFSDVLDEPRLSVQPNPCNETGVTSSEGASQKYKIRLTSKPSSPVTVKFNIEQPDGIAVAKFKNDLNTLTFEPDKYNISQTIEIVGIKPNYSGWNNAASRPYSLSYTFMSNDPNFQKEHEDACTISLQHVLQTYEESAPKTHRLRIMSANTTDGPSQRYDEFGMRTFYALDPDIILIQEFTNYYFVLDGLQTHFGQNYHYYRGRGSIPNGVITKSQYPIIANYTHQSNIVSDRNWEAAVVDIPGDKDLLVVSLHLNTKRHSQEMPELVEWIRELQQNGDYYLVVGGDFNTSTGYSIQQNMSSILYINNELPEWPVDQENNYNTNNARYKHFDWILTDPDFHRFSTSTVIGSQSYPYGFVLDSRIHSPLSEIQPVQKSDVVNMQHMPIIRDFVYEY